MAKGAAESDIFLHEFAYKRGISRARPSSPMLRPAATRLTIMAYRLAKPGHGIKPGNKCSRDNNPREGKMTKDRKSTTATRRKFLGGAAVAGVASVVAPSVVKAQGPITMRWQSTWPSKDIFHEYALDLRQDGQRHDRRRSQDRSAARRRRGAGIRADRCGVKGHARRRPRRAGLSLRQAKRAGAVGLGSGLRHGRQHAAGLAQVGRRQGASAEALCDRSA